VSKVAGMEVIKVKKGKSKVNPIACHEVPEEE
jgi:hypothetical protein